MKYSTHDDPLWPMSHTIRVIAECWFEIPSLSDGEWPRPKGLLVGEQPRPGGNPKLPLWPWPAGGSGGRLFPMSRMRLLDFFVDLARVNVSKYPVARWSANQARSRGIWILDKMPDGARVVARGARARDAFGVGEFFRKTEAVRNGVTVELVAIPHPSGRCREYNDPDNVRLAGSWIRWAAGRR